MCFIEAQFIEQAGTLVLASHSEDLLRRYCSRGVILERGRLRYDGSLYRAFDTYADLLPPRLTDVAPRMAAEDWLRGYGDPDNVRRALEGIARRMRRETPIARGHAELERRHGEIEACVLEVWPEASRWIQARRAALRAGSAQPK